MSTLDDIRARTPNVSEEYMGQTEKDRARLLAALTAVTEALDDWESAVPFPDAEKSQQWYSLGKRHAAERIRFEITEALEGS